MGWARERNRERASKQAGRGGGERKGGTERRKNDRQGKRKRNREERWGQKNRERLANRQRIRQERERKAVVMVIRQRNRGESASITVPSCYIDNKQERCFHNLLLDQIIIWIEDFCLGIDGFTLFPSSK